MRFQELILTVTDLYHFYWSCTNVQLLDRPCLFVIGLLVDLVMVVLVVRGELGLSRLCFIMSCPQENFILHKSLIYYDTFMFWSILDQTEFVVDKADKYLTWTFKYTLYQMYKINLSNHIFLWIRQQQTRHHNQNH